MKKYIGKPCEIRFYDHCQVTGGEASPVIVTLYGIPYKEDKIAVYISVWQSDGEISDENSDTYCLIKHPGLKIKICGK